MIRVYALLVLLFFFCTGSAQVVAVNDSVSTGAGFNQMVFYSLATGIKTPASNTDWHLAVSVRPTQYPASPLGGTTIRHNGPNGVSVYIAPATTVATFNTLDTTGWRNWRRLYDSDTLVDLGAFNSNRSTSNIFDFGWGKYNGTTHNVTGDSVYLIQLPNGDLKKFMVVALVFDTAFDLRYSNIDNSDLQNIHIGKADYAGKQFVYLNMEDNSVKDKEPLAADWDMQFIQYLASDVTPGTWQARAGVWVNMGTTVAKATSVALNSNDYHSLTFSKHLNSIGWDWEIHDSLQYYHVQDSLVYFINAKNGNYYKVIFTGFDGSSTGIFSFYPQAQQTGIAETVNNIQGIFPNPASNTLNILTDNTGPSSLKVYDISGKMVAEQSISASLTPLNISGFTDGLYLLAVTTRAGTSFSRFVKTQ